MFGNRAMMIRRLVQRCPSRTQVGAGFFSSRVHLPRHHVRGASDFQGVRTIHIPRPSSVVIWPRREPLRNQKSLPSDDTGHSG